MFFFDLNINTSPITWHPFLILLLQHWDGTGGNGSALRHFEATGKKYPLVVKLGTITPAGADVYSYAEDENDMVLDPKLPEHLAHWGINILQVGIALVQSGYEQ